MTVQDVFTIRKYAKEIERLDQGGDGQGAEISITTDLVGPIRSDTVVINNAGIGYIKGDIVSLTTGTIDATFEILKVDTGVVRKIRMLNAGGGFAGVAKNASLTGGTGTGLTIDYSLAGSTLASVTVEKGGFGYETARVEFGDMWVIDPPRCTVNISNGSVSSVDIDYPGILSAHVPKVYIKPGPPANAANLTTMIEQFDSDLQQERLTNVIARIKATKSISEEMETLLDSYPS